MTFNQHPSSAAMNPMMPDPNRMLMGRTVPAARNPYVPSTVVAVISIDPNISSFGTGPAAFDDGSRRPHANINLRK